MHVRKPYKIGFYLLCLNLVFGAFQNCSPVHSPIKQEEFSSLGQYPAGQLNDKFSATLQPVLRANCARCHGVDQNPKFAVENPQAAVSAINMYSLVKFDDPEASRFITQIRSGHNGFTEELAQEVLTGILAWKAALEGTPPPPPPPKDTEAPAVMISAPADGATVNDVVVVSAIATDDVGVVGVQFYIDNVAYESEDDSDPYTINWNTNTLAKGSHTVHARARDAAGNSKVSSIITVNVDNTPPDTTNPTVEITSPADNANVSGTVTLTATAADNIAVAGVRFYVDGAPTGNEVTSAPYTLALDTTAFSMGSHALTARARDAAGNFGDSALVSINIDNTPADTIRPSVNLTAPASGANVTGTITVSASASDNVGVVGVQFYVDGTASGDEVLTPPYSILLNTSGLSNAAHSITARARDAAGNTRTTAARTVTVNNTTTDTSLPTVLVTSPSANSNVSATITVTATASDNAGIAGVQFYADGVAIGAEDTSAPYSVSWDTTSVANGTRSLTARARDTAGNLRTSAAVNVNVNNADDTLPSISISAPTAGSSVSGPVIVSATASDNVGVVGVQFYVDGAALGNEDLSAPYTISWNSAQSANGTRTITARARDAAGNERTSSQVNVTVSNADIVKPSVSITSPSTGSTVSASVIINATASDNLGVVGVQFFINGTALGSEDTSEPYTYSWATATVADGTHMLTARARDAAGNTTTSSTVSVTVRNMANPNATYTWLAQNVLSRCTSCHRSGKAENGKRFDTYTETIKSVRAGDPARSQLYTITYSGQMPETGSRLTATQMQAIYDWIAAGALNN